MLRTLAILLTTIFLGFVTEDYANELETNLRFTESRQNVQLNGSVQLASGSSVERNIGGGYQNTYSSQSSQNSDGSDSNNKTRVLIWLEQPNESSRQPRSEPVVLDQKNQRFHPRLVPVFVGETVRIENSDPVYHNVFSLSKPHRFDVGRRPKGDHKDLTFDKPGMIDVFCDIHSDMHALIVVMPRTTTTWTTRKGSGQFKFENLEAGEYQIRATALGYETHSETINIEGNQQTVELSSIRLER